MNSNALLDFEGYITNQQVLEEASKSIRSLKKDVTAFSKAVDQDGDRIKQGLEKVVSAIKEIRDKGANLNLVSESDRAALRELIKQVAGLTAEQGKLKQAQEGTAAAQRNMREAAGLYTKELVEQRKALVDAAKANDVEGQKKAALAIQGLAAQQKEFSKAVRGSASELTAAAGSYNAADQALQKLRAELRALEGGLDGSSPRAQELGRQIGELDAKLRAADKTMGIAYRNVGNYTQSILDAVRALEQEKAALTAASTALRNQATASGLTADQQDRLQQEIRQTDEALDRVNDGLRGYGVNVDDASGKNEGFLSSLKKYVLTLALATFGFEALGQAASSVFQSNAQFSDQIADVRKTTGLAADEADRLADNLKKIDTRTSLSGLLDIAKVGGQLGIAKDDILDFTKAVDVAVQALGDDFTGGAEEIATTLGKIALNFKKELGPDVAANLTAIGSSINEIGAEGAATAPFVANVTLRVSQLASQYGLGLKNAIAYAAVLEETGTSAEVAGSSLNRLFSTIAGKTEASFRIAKLGDNNLTLKEFTRLVNTDFNQAIQVFLKGLNAGGKSTTEVNRLLATLKLESGEAKNTILALAQNTELFAARQQVANDQLRDATSLAEEASIKGGTLAGSFAKLKNNISNLVTDGSVGRFFKGAIDFFNGGILYTEKAQDTVASRSKKTIADGQQALQAVAFLNSQLARYAELSNSATRNVPEAQAIKELDSITRTLRDTFGDSIGVINKQTGAFDLNVAAVKQKLKEDNELYDASAKTLAKQLLDINKRKAAEESLNQALSKSTDARARLLSEGAVKPEDLENIREFLDKQARGITNGRNARLSADITNEQAQAVRAYDAELDKLAKSGLRLEQIDRDRAALLNGLKAIGLDSSQALRLLSVEQTKAAGDAADAEEDNVGVFNKAAKARAATRRKQLEGELADQQRLLAETKAFLEEQARLFEEGQISKEILQDNVAGTQEVLVNAEKKSSEIRIAILRATKAEAIAQADEELNAVLRKNKVTNKEIQDAREAHLAILQGIHFEFNAKRLEEENALQNKLIKIYNKPLDFRPVGIDPAALEKAEKALDFSNERGLARMQKDYEKRKEQYDKDAENKLKAEERKRRIQQQTFDLAAQAAQAFFELQARQNYAAIQNLEQNYQLGLAALGDNEEAKARLTEEYNEKSRVAKRRAAQQEKTAALFSIALSTAKATIEGFFELGPIGAALAIGLGAVQAALVLATPLPAYFKGREGGPAEWAMVGERGPELIQGKSGGMKLVDKPSIVYLEANDKVLTAQRTQEFLRASEQGMVRPLPFQESLKIVNQQLNQSATMKDNQQLTELSTKLDRVVQTIERMPGFKLDITDRGIEKIFESKNNLTTRLNQRLKGLGR